MKLLLLALSTFGIMHANNSFAFAISKPPIAEMPTYIGTNIKASEFVRLSANDFSRLSGKKLSLWNRLSFSVLKMRIKHDLKSNPNLNMSDYYSKKAKGRVSVWWFVGIGVLLLLVIFLIGGAGTVHP